MVLPGGTEVICIITVEDKIYFFFFFRKTLSVGVVYVCVGCLCMLCVFAFITVELAPAVSLGRFCMAPT